MRRLRRIAMTFLVLSAVIATCYSLHAQRGIFRTKTSVIVLKEAPKKPKDAPIEILGSKPEDRKHEELCIINAKGGQTIFNAKNSSELLEKIKEDARKCGADAIIIRDSEDRTWQATGGFEQAKSSVLAIRFLEE